MKKLFAAAVFFAALGLVFSSGLYAKQGMEKKVTKTETTVTTTTTATVDTSKEKAKGKAKSETPAGWSKGQKTGWQGKGYPPGWSKWDGKKKAKWESDRESAMAEIDSISRKYRIKDSQIDEIENAFNDAIVGGKLIDDSRKKLVNALEDKTQRKHILLDAGQNVLELLK